MAKFDTWSPSAVDGFHQMYGRITSWHGTKHHTLNDCIHYLERLLYCLDDPNLNLDKEADADNDFLIVIKMPPTHTYLCKNCQIVLPCKLYSYIKRREFLRPPNGGRLDPHFESKEAMLLSLIYVISKLFGVCLYRRISAHYLFEQYRSDSEFREALCAFAIFAIDKIMENHQNWIRPRIFPFGINVIGKHLTADLSPFGMAAGAFSRFLYLFTVHSGKMRGIKAPSNIQKRVESLEMISEFLCKRMRRVQIYDEFSGVWMEWQLQTRRHLSQIISCFLNSVRGLQSPLYRTGFHLIEDPYAWKRGALLRAVTCQWKLCDKENRYHTNKDVGKFKKCGSCKSVRYCSIRCQKLDWNRGCHKQICLYLTRSMMDNA